MSKDLYKKISFLINESNYEDNKDVKQNKTKKNDENISK